MKLKHFHAENLFSLGEVDLNLDKLGLVLVTGYSKDEGGANGSGKSSLSNKALLWTMYGSSAGGERADSVVNRFAGKDATCSGSIDVESNNGSLFRISRSRNPSRLTLVDLSTNTDISCKLEKETQILIDQILGRSRETFLQTDFFGQGRLSAFMDLTPKAQVEVLETILPFDRLAELGETVKNNLAQLNKVQYSVDKHVSEYTGKLLEATRQERQLSESIDQWDTSHDAEVAELERQIAAIPTDVEFEAKIEEWKLRIETIPNRKEAEAEIHFHQRNVEDSDEYINAWLGALERWKMPSAVPEPRDSEVCPTCEQGISSNTQESLKTKYFKYLEDCREVELSIGAIKNSINKIKAAKLKHQILRDEAEQCIRTHDMWEREIASVEATRANDNLAILKKTLADKKLEKNPYTELYRSLASNIHTVTTSLGHHKKRGEEIEGDRHALEFWQAAFTKELKNVFIDQVCPFLEGKANLHLEALGNGQIKVKISTNKTLKNSEARSEFTISAVSSSGGGNYEALSGGERQLLNFSMGLALADLAELQATGPSYFMVLDEPFTALDARNSEALVGYLNSAIAGRKDTILLVSNEDNLKNLIPNRINVIKENGVSRLET